LPMGMTETQGILQILAHLYVTTQLKCEAIHVNRKKYSVRKMCRALGIPQCSYYQWSKQETARAERKTHEEQLVRKIRDTFEENNRVYGCPRMQATRHVKGVEVKVCTLRRIMRENGLYPITLRKWKPYRKGKCGAMYSENLVQRRLNPVSLNAVCAGDIAYIKTMLGWVYIAVVLELSNKKAVGCTVNKNIDTELVKRALSNAIMRRGHHNGFIFHSNRGVQYSNMGCRTMLPENGITPSMSVPGFPYDNACMESFFASFKKELTYRCDFKDLENVREAVFRYIGLFYNRKRLHSLLGYKTPMEEYRLSKQAA